LCQIILLLLPPLHVIWHNQNFCKIWGEIGNKLGRKNITKYNLNEI
jgi:hypothetical protein